MLKTGRSTQDQHPCGGGAFNPESVRNLARPEDVGARPRLEPFAIADECHFAVQDVKRFIFKMVPVVRRSKTRRHRQMLDQSKCTVRSFARSPYDGRQTE